MKSRINTLFLIITITLQAYTGMAQFIRPIRDDVGYCWKMGDMIKLIGYLKESETSKKIENIIAGISPHDDYLYAGRVYYTLFRSIRSKEAVIFGVTHGTVRREIGDPQNIILLDGYDEWKGPIKNIQISPLREFIKMRLDTSLFRVDNKAHSLEHSIEGQLPFLQYYNREIKITPMMITAMPFEKMDEISGELAAIISEYVKEKNLIIGEDIVFLISSDANHYGKDFNNIPFGEDSAAHKKAIEQDRRIADNYLKNEIQLEKIKMFTEEMKNVVWCGKYSIPFGLLTTKKVVDIVKDKNLKGEIVMYSDTYTEGVLPVKATELGTTAPYSLKHWCGFLSGVFFADTK